MKLHLLLWSTLLLLLTLSLMTGATSLSLTQAVNELLSGTEGISSLVLIEVRLPRTLLAALIGSALGASGAALQGMLRNPLASPDLLGVSQTASLAAVVTLYFGFSAGFFFLLPLAAMCGALAGAVFICLLAGRFPSIFTLILAGLALNTFTSALIALALNLAPNSYALQEIYFWLLGSVANTSLPELAFAAPVIITGTGLLLASVRWLDALSLGEETAGSLGFNNRRNLWLIVAGVSLCTGASVAVAGNIGFIGLLVPHLVRPMVRHSPAQTLVSSIPAGAILLLVADLLVRIVPTNQELQLGVLTSILGGPFFLWLVLVYRKGGQV